MSEPVILPDNRHEAVWEWLQTCPYIGDLFFNASRAEDGNTQLIPSETIVKTFIDGSKLMHYDCALTRFMAYSADPNDEENLMQLIDFEMIGDWIQSAVASGNLPAFPAGYTLSEISVLPSQSGYMVAQDYSQAKYMIQFQIEYIH